jgi:hypothetical protein
MTARRGRLHIKVGRSRDTHRFVGSSRVYLMSRTYVRLNMRANNGTYFDQNLWGTWDLELLLA